MSRSLVLACCAVALTATSATGQYFGQNQVQYRDFSFSVIETEHFDIYYYDDVRDAAVDAARMAERAYGRLSRLLNHQYRERQPVILYASHAEFQQNNLMQITEGVQGVTDPFRHRVMLPFTGSYAEFEHVLQHELVHQFQFDVFASGHIGAGIDRLMVVQPPLWLMEGMAEYLSVGPGATQTAMWMRDAVFHDDLPTVDALTQDQRIFPYRYGHALMEYIGQRWGDEMIAEILHGVAAGGLESGIRRALRMSLAELSEAWHADVRDKYEHEMAGKVEPSEIAKPVLSHERSTGHLNVSPALSPDGKKIAYFSERDAYSVNLYLADVETGQVERRLVKSAFSSDFESLRFLSSGGAWSPDGRFFAFPVKHGGRDDLVLFDVARNTIASRLSIQLAGIANPSWSPDGKQLVFTGFVQGSSDLFVINADGTDLRRLTNDRHATLHPAWSPDGGTIAFATDRGPRTDFDELRPGRLVIALFDLETHEIQTLPYGGGNDVNPQWAPNGNTLAFVSDRTGTANLFLFDLQEQALYKLTDVPTGISGIMPTSPAISWARHADRLALTYYERGDYNVYAVDAPDALRRAPFASPRLVAAGGDQSRQSDESPLPNGDQNGTSDGSGPGIRANIPPRRLRPLSVKALLDSASLALPDTTTFSFSKYSPTLHVDYVSQPSVAYVHDAFGSGVYGGAAVSLSDILGNRRLIVGGQINGRITESQILAVYANMARRTNWAVGIVQTPVYFFAGSDVSTDGVNGHRVLNQRLQRFVQRRVFADASRPFSRFSRIEYSINLINVDVGEVNFQTMYDPVTGFIRDRELERTSFGNHSYAQPALAWVFDNSRSGWLGPELGRRSRLEYAPAFGSWHFHQALLDTRRYDKLPGPFVLATRLLFFGRFGRDANEFPIFLGTPDLLRGYTSGSFRRRECDDVTNGSIAPCSELTQLIGSRIAVANVELRFPLVRRFSTNSFPLSMPPIDGAIFFDTGMAWRDGSQLGLTRNADEDATLHRQPLSSLGASIRGNLFGMMVLRLDFTKPLNRSERTPYWTLSLGPTF